jgi:hypothetical protein
MTRSLRVLCCVACLLVADRADAELSITLSNKELATRSDVIVVGRAVGSSSRWVGRTLMTAVTLQVRAFYVHDGCNVMYLYGNRRY